MDNKIERLVDLINTLKAKGINIDIIDPVTNQQELEVLIEQLKYYFKMKEER